MDKLLMCCWGFTAVGPAPPWLNRALVALLRQDAARTQLHRSYMAAGMCAAAWKTEK